MKIHIYILTTLFYCFISPIMGQEYTNHPPLLLNLELDWSEIPIIEMEEVDNNGQRVLHSESNPTIFAKSFDINIDLKHIGLRIDSGDGSIIVLGVKSPSAYSINLIFKEFHLAHGAYMNLYNDSFNHVIGSFDGSFNPKDSGILGTMPVKGDMIYIEIYEPLNTESICVIGKVSHDFLNYYANDPKRSILRFMLY